MRAIKKHKWLKLTIALLLGGVVVIAIRFATIKNTTVHYHANFALYVNDVHDEFSGPGYYEEVQACSTTEKDNPRARVHMHNNENHIVHVHDNAVTWGDFFANLGYTLGDKALVTNQGVFVDNADGNKLTFILNGKTTDAIADRVIGNEDVLLIDYGKDDNATIQKDYDAIPRDAHKENLEKDPASCGGASAHWSTTDRLKHAAEFWQ